MPDSLRRGKSGSRASPEARLTRRFTACLVALAVTVACLQILLRFENVRRLLNESIRLEGVPLGRVVEGLDDPVYPWLDWQPGSSGPAGAGETAVIYLRLLHEPPGEVWVLVNGRAIRAMDRDGAVIPVADGDRVEVYCPEGRVEVVVSSASPGLSAPEVGVWAGGEGRVFVTGVEMK